MTALPCHIMLKCSQRRMTQNLLYELVDTVFFYPNRAYCILYMIDLSLKGRCGKHGHRSGK